MRQSGPEDLSAVLDGYWDTAVASLEATDATALPNKIAVGSAARPARQFLRRMLEHSWEHLQELRRPAETRGA